MDRRHNWQEDISQEAQQRHERKMQLLAQLPIIRDELRACGADWEKYDEISLKYRETVAQLATL